MRRRQLIGWRGGYGRMRSGVRSVRSGVTLTEAVVASALLLIAVVPVLKALVIAQTTDRAVERRTRSLMFAQRELERIEARSIYHYDDSFAGTSMALDGSFLASVADDEDSSLRQITVSVGQDRNGDGLLASDEIEVRLCTYLARRWPGS